MPSLHEQVKEVEESASLIDVLRSYAKNESGNLTEFGKNFIKICRESDFQQVTIAKILAISQGSVSQHVGRLKE